MAFIGLATLVILFLGYTFYGRFIARQYALDDGAVTPAVSREDGVDFVPTRPFYLLGQHFSAIAAAGPIAGPIMACLTFGWLPCLIWIAFGSVFIGAVHDFSSLVASVRHGAASVAEVMREHVGKRAWVAMMAFIWLALVYVLVAFADITANTFVGKTEELEGSFSFNPGGAVAAASTMYLGLAIVMGLVERYLKPPLWLETIIFVPATLCAVWLGTKVSTVLILDGRAWAMVILAYCFVAALLPVWLLLQPRGYLGGFVLYISLAVGVIGIFGSGLPIQQPMFKSWNGPKMTDALFPFLFVTIACGACSGFHGLVCSGTTSKQISKESHCHPVGYGAMLLEGFVALVSLATVMFVAADELKGRGPGRIYGDGIGQFLSLVIGKENRVFAATFGAMAFSTFVFDTLDVATRLGRYIIQELLRTSSTASALAATLLTVGVPGGLILASSGGGGGVPTYMLFWTLFGTANQLLAALTLLGITVWLKKSGRRSWFTAVPMVFVMGMTTWSLCIQIYNAFSQPLALNPTLLNGVVALMLLGLAVFLVLEALKALGGGGVRPVEAAPEAS